MTTAQLRLVALDLDGTLVDGNTLHIYIMCGIRQALCRGHVLRALRIAAWPALRAIRAVSHRTMKFGAIRLIRPDDALQRTFVHAVRARLNPRVVDAVNQWRCDGYTVLLATAAADVYVPWIWNGPYVATPADGSAQECRGAQKLQAVQNYCLQHGLTLHTAVSDHTDDIPLLAAAQHCVLVKPTLALRQAAVEAGWHVRVLD